VHIAHGGRREPVHHLIAQVLAARWQQGRRRLLSGPPGGRGRPPPPAARAEPAPSLGRQFTPSHHEA
jgi:hypothetical protein